MKVNASWEAVDFVHKRGGKLFVWSRSTRFCHGAVAFLKASTAQREDQRAFRRVATEGIEFYVALRGSPRGSTSTSAETGAEVSALTGTAARG